MFELLGYPDTFLGFQLVNDLATAKMQFWMLFVASFLALFGIVGTVRAIFTDWRDKKLGRDNQWYWDKYYS